MTGTDLIRPDTGELIPITEIHAGLEKLTMDAIGGEMTEIADVLDALRRLDAEIASLKRLLQGEVGARGEHLGKKSLRLGDGRMLVISGGKETTVDPVKLAAALRRAGMPDERVDEIVTTTVTQKVNLVLAKQAAAANEKYARALKRCSTTREKATSVSIEKG